MDNCSETGRRIDVTFHEFMEPGWNPAVVKAAKAMYRRLRIADRERYPKWRDLDIDSFDHYCIAAQLAIEAFHHHGTKTITVVNRVECTHPNGIGH